MYSDDCSGDVRYYGDGGFSGVGDGWGGKVA